MIINQNLILKYLWNILTIILFEFLSYFLVIFCSNEPDVERKPNLFPDFAVENEPYEVLCIVYGKDKLVNAEFLDSGNKKIEDSKDGNRKFTRETGKKFLTYL